MQECQRLAVEALPILCKSAATVEPSDGTFDDPPFWQHGKGMERAAFDDLDNPVARTCSGLRGARSLIASIGKNTRNEWKLFTGSAFQNQYDAVTILNIGGMHDAMQQQAQCIYENMPLLALDLFSCIVTMRIDAGSPFSALLTLWLSMMAAVGVAARPSRSRHFT